MLRGAVGVLGLGALALMLSAWGLESWRFTPGSIVTFRIAAGSRVRQPHRLVHRSAAAAGASPTSRWRCTSRSTSRRSRRRSSARSRRAGWRSRMDRRTRSGWLRASSSLRCAKCQAIDWGRNVERSPMRRYATTFAVDRHRGGRALLARPALPPSRPVGAPRRLAQRAGRRAVPDRRRARQRERAARRGSDDHGDARRVRGLRSVADDPQVARHAVRARGARAQREQRRGQQVRRHAVRSGVADRLLRRSRGREVGDVHAEGRRSPLRPEARARAPLPRLHRARAAQDRGRRRPRRAQGHRGPRQGRRRR